MIYLAGPMSNIKHCNRPAFHAAAAELRARRHTVWNPAELPVGWEWETYLRTGLRLLLDATEMVVLPGWEQSRGAQLEVAVARAIGLPMTTIEEALS